MSPTTWRHSTTGSATAATRVTAPTRLARRRCRSALPTHSLYHSAQGFRHLFGLGSAQRREERQGDRARRDVLADRELAVAVAEALAVVRHQMDRRQVGLGLHAALAQRQDGRVAIEAGRQLDDEDEPPALVAVGVLAGQLEALDVAEQLAVPPGHARAGGEHVVEPAELGDPQRAGEVAQPVVEAEAVMVEPAHVGRAALV